MTQNDFEKMLTAPGSREQINGMLMGSNAINMLFDQAKRMMWSVVEYKDL